MQRVKPALLRGFDQEYLPQEQLQFERDSWVQIRGPDGKVLLSQLHPAGTERFIEGRPPFDLVIGNAQHVRLRYDDRDVDLAPHLKIDVARLKLE